MNREGPLKQLGPQEYQMVERVAHLTVANLAPHLTVVDGHDGHPRLGIAVIERRLRHNIPGGTYHAATLTVLLARGEEPQ